MKTLLLKLVCCLSALGLVSSSYGLTIVPSYDGSITNDPNGPAMVAAINAAIQVLQSNISDTATVLIHFTNDTTVSLGQSSTWGNTYSYPAYLAALKSSATSINDTNALSQLTNISTDPLLGGTSIYLTLALAVRMGLDTGYGSDGFDSTISLNMPLMNFTRPGANPNNYDLQATVEHEMDEVLGTSSGLPKSTNLIWAMDLFRYTTNLVRTYALTGDNAYFSVDGTNLWARFNTDTNGDFADWWSANGTFWAPPGQTPHPQVQDAFGNPGTFEDLGPNELAMLDAIGWTLTSAKTTSAPKLLLASSGSGQLTLTWADSSQGFVLQESTSLLSNSWVTSASGTNNPATITISGSQKFYRLHNPAAPVVSQVAPASPDVVPSRRTTPLQLTTRVYKPHRR